MPGGARVVEGFLDLETRGPAVATIGNFDGAHLGHQAIFSRVHDRARARGLPAVAITFDPHPLKVLRPDRAPRMILTRGQKIEILEEAGFDTLIFIPFDRSVAEVEAERFVVEFLLGRLQIRELYIGIDFRFGRGRQGDPDLLRRIGAERDLAVETVPVVEHAGERISASRIRACLERGDVSEAAAMMGRPYEAIGEVVHGSGRGRIQGAPTANLAVENETVPGAGVYVTATRIRGEGGGETTHASLTNIGTRPTFEGAGFAVETWLPDFSGDLYGRRLRVAFHGRVRDEKKFPTPEALREQIGRDLRVMREFFRPGKS